MERSTGSSTRPAQTTGWMKLIIKYVKLGYHFSVDHILITIFLVLIIPLMLGLAVEGLRIRPSNEMAAAAVESLGSLQVCSGHLQLLCCLFVVIFCATVYFMSKPRNVYLVDYACFKPPETLRFSSCRFEEHWRLIFSPESISFMTRILEKSGLGDETYFPHELHYIPPSPTMERCRSEAELVIFSSIDKLLSHTGGVTPKDIDVLVLNCSLFCPTPSLTAMVVNKYKMRSNIKTFNLGGMGCSGNSIAVDLARDLLQVHPSLYALVVSTEILTGSFYTGDERGMLLPTCLFRMGCVAMLLSNKRKDRRRAKYKLLHVVRTHTGADDDAFKCVHKMTDSKGKEGIFLSKDLMKIAGVSLKSNITTIAPLILPASEQLLFLFSLIVRKLFNPKRKPYKPDLKQAFEHICIHAGGRVVIDGVQKNLDLSDEQVEASRMTLHRFGNTSSSCLWYEMAYIEAKERMKRGDKVWQIFFGSGYKCCSIVWKCNRDIKPPTDGPWADSIHRYPVHTTEVVQL